MAGIRLTAAAARRIAKSTVAAERRPQNRPAPPPRFPLAPAVPSGRLAKTPTAGIPARSGNTLGSATCRLYDLVAGVRVDSGEDVTVYNDAPTALLGDKEIQVKPVQGEWVADVYYCPTS